MAATFKVDGLDLSTHLKVNQGDGLDPYDTQGFLEPQFAEGALSDGDPLISIREGNREQAWPVILNPAKAGYAASKDGLHQLVRDINRALAAAATVEWRDDGATNSTFYDAQFARFDPAWDFRRSQKQWVPGVIRVWARPYGHTATMRVIGTTIATGRPWPTAVIATSLDGDTDAQIDVALNWVPAGGGTVYPATGRLFAGFCVMSDAQASIAAFRPAASLLGIGALTSASGAAASQMLRLTAASGTINDLAVLASGADYRPATAGLRLLALLRNNTTATIIISSYDSLTGAAVGVTQMLEPGKQWRVTDLGIIREQLQVGIRTQVFQATSQVDIAGALMLPEDRTVAAFTPVGSFSSRPPVASHFFGAATSSMPRVSLGATAAQTLLIPLDQYAVGQVPGAPPGTRSFQVQPFALPDDGPQNGAVSAEIRVRERFTFAR